MIEVHPPKNWKKAKLDELLGKNFSAIWCPEAGIIDYCDADTGERKQLQVSQGITKIKPECFHTDGTTIDVYLVPKIGLGGIGGGSF